MPANPFPVLATHAPRDHELPTPGSGAFAQSPQPAREHLAASQQRAPEQVGPTGAAQHGALYGAWIAFLLGLVLAVAPVVSIPIGAAGGALTGFLWRQTRSRRSRH